MLEYGHCGNGAHNFLPPSVLAKRSLSALSRLVSRPSRRQARNLTAFERATGWRYSIIVTNIPAAGGIGGVPGSHHAQFIDVLHRQHAVVEDGVRAAKSMGLRNLPSKARMVNCGDGATGGRSELCHAAYRSTQA
jgi:hypothetical protein